MQDDSYILIEHLKLVQSVVNRMAGNSALVKTWTIPAVAAILVFSGIADFPHWLVAFGGCILVIAFWTLDARYLQLERSYIKLYDAVADQSSVKPYDLDSSPYITEVGSVWNIAWSWSVLSFYAPLFLITLALFIVLII